VVFLLFGPHLAMLLRAQTRELYLWQTRDALFVLGTMFLLALVCVAVGELVRRLNRRLLTRLFNHVFVVALGAGLLANLASYSGWPGGYRIYQYGMPMQTAWLLLAGVVGYSLTRPGSKLVLRARQFCLIISPAVPIFAVQLFAQDTYSAGMDPIPAGSSIDALAVSDSADAAGPVYLFVFDQWSYTRTFTDGAVRPEFANLAELAGRSIVFHNAESPGNMTHLSMPRMLLRTDLPVVVGDGRIGFERDGRFVPGWEFESIFSATAGRRYRSMMIGTAFPYGMLLGDQVDICRTHYWIGYYRPDDPLVQCCDHVYRAAQRWTDPWSRYLCDKLRRRVDVARALWYYRDMNRDIMEVIKGQPRNTFAVFHYALPHFPAVLEVNGGNCGLRRDWQSDDADSLYDVNAYERNLHCTDWLIGRITAAMKQYGRYDDALLIITSDHDWQRDPNSGREWTDDAYRHVPLFVKLPGQDRSLEVTSLFETRNLGSLIAWALDTDRRLEGFDRFLQRTVAAKMPSPVPPTLETRRTGTP